MTPQAVPTETVLIDEFRLIWPEADPPADTAACGAAAFGRGQAALCLSGGGIRSAAFALGVLQGLSGARLLDRFHYLSTCSGGGYIGSWLQRWIADSSPATVMAALGGADEPPQVTALRENSNYITPRVGAGSNDTWTAVAVSVRNILINGLLFAPVFLLVGLVPNAVAAGIGATPGAQIAHVMLALAAAFLAVATMWTCLALPSYRADDGGPQSSGERWVNLRIILPLWLWSVFGTVALSPMLLDADPAAPTLQHLAVANVVGMGMGVLFAALFAGRRRRAVVSDLPLWAAAIGLSTVVLLIGARWAVRGTLSAGISHYSTEILATLGPLLAVAAQLAATVVFVTFRTVGPSGGIAPDADREWLARLSALKLKPSLLWAVVGIAAFGLNSLIDYMLRDSKIDLSLAGIVTIASGVVAVLGGRSSGTGGPIVSTGVAFIRRLPLQVSVALGTAVFALALFTLHSRLEQALAAMLAYRLAAHPLWPEALLNPWVVAHLLIAAVLGAALWFLARRIPVNRFSLNGFYRNRLSRAFLGAARRVRRPDPFTGFDSEDNVRMHGLVRPKGERQLLYPVVNVALNITQSEKLAWQERKAAPFVFTPLYSGSDLLTREDAGDGKPGAFLPSHQYGGNEPDLALGGSGVTLATAMAISGAAASPNRGYHSSPATAFLMTLFNVRLGAWLPNPARAKSLREKVMASGPSNNLRAVLRDLAGATQDSGRDIYLSDGGHFDNLGLYEMVRRRCRYIVVSDAGCDPNCAFGDLGAAVRKAAIDQNIRIDFTAMHISRRGHDIDPQFAYAVGTIHYPDLAEPGHILYIKPSFFGAMPIDVTAYAATSPSFPHEPTSDQFFSESQFESYRALGRFLTAGLCAGADGDLAALFEALDPAAPAADEAEEEEGLH